MHALDKIKFKEHLDTDKEVKLKHDLKVESKNLDVDLVEKVMKKTFDTSAKAIVELVDGNREREILQNKMDWIFSGNSCNGICHEIRKTHLIQVCKLRQLGTKSERQGCVGMVM